MKKFFLLLLSVVLIFTISACKAAPKKEVPNASIGHSENVSEAPNADDNHDETTGDQQNEIVNTPKEFVVTFKDFDGSVLKTETVKKGGKANSPVGFKRDGYRFTKWDTSFENVTEDLIVTAVYEEIKTPTLIVDTVYAKGKDVVVKVYIQKNPGILSLLLNTTYIENAMELTKIESGKAMTGYTFVGPKNLINGCNAAWHIIDVPEKVTDGEVALLHFRLKKDAAPGAYKISVSCQNGAFDRNYKEVKFETINGYVMIESEETTK